MSAAARGAALLALLAAPALADERSLDPAEILGPDDHAHLFAEVCLSDDPAGRLSASPHFEVERGNRYSTPNGLAVYQLTDTSCELGLAPGAADYGLALEEALIAHMDEAAPDAARETLAAGLAWEWEADGVPTRVEYLEAEDAYIITLTR